MENNVGRSKSPLKLWQVLLEVAAAILLQCFFPGALIEGIDFLAFIFLCQRSGG